MNEWVGMLRNLEALSNTNGQKFFSLINNNLTVTNWVGMLRNGAVCRPESPAWVDMLRNNGRRLPKIRRKSLFLPVFGWVSAGMADFFLLFLLDF